MYSQLILSLLLLQFSFAAHFKGVLVLNDDNFFSEIHNDFTFVNFYSTTCQHCHRLGPMVELLANLYNETRVTIAHLEGKQNKIVRANENIIGFPTLRLYSHGEHIASFGGIRTLDNMVDFITSHTGISPNYGVSSVAEIQDGEIEKNSIVAVVAPWLEDWNQRLTKFEKLARANPQLKFYKLDSSDPENAELLSRFQISKYPTVIYYGDVTRRLERDVENRMEEFLISDISDDTCKEEATPGFKHSYSNKELDEEEAFKRLREL